MTSPGRPPYPEGAHVQSQTALHPEIAERIAALAEVYGTTRGHVLKAIVHAWYLTDATIYPGLLTREGFLKGCDAVKSVMAGEAGPPHLTRG